MSPSRARAHVTFASVAAPLAILTAALVWLAVSTGALSPDRKDAADAPAGTVSPAPIVAPLVPDAETGLALPKKLGSLRFAVIGDVGRGDDAQYGTAAEMARWRERFDFSFVLMLGDNMYAAGTPDDYAARFERPYQPLLDKGVTFYAANGNHDPPNILDYPLYNMNGNRYYTFARSEGALAMRKVKFFAVDTVMLDSVQLAWLRRELGASDDGWEIAFFHHPLYTSGRYSAGALRIRRGARAGVPAVRHGRRAGRTRARVRTAGASGRHPLFHVGRRRRAARGRRASKLPDGRGVRHGHAFHIDGDFGERLVFSDDQPHGTDDRYRTHRAPDG